MKKIVISTVLFASLFAVSCDQSLLDIPQKGVISIEDFYQTEEDAESAALAVYASGAQGLINPPLTGGTGIYMPYILMTNLPSDDLYAAGNVRGDNDFAAQVNEFRFSTDNEVLTRAYRGLYQIIYAANLVTTNFEYGRSGKIDRNISEARVWRAWSHLVLTMFWGTPPRIDYVLAGGDRPANDVPREELLNWIIAELGESASDLPARQGPGDRNGAVRLTREAAYSFMGKAQVVAGKYAEAATNLRENVIKSNNYELIPGEQMHDLFHMAGNGNSEKIFEFNVVENPGITTGNMNNLTSWMHNNMWHWRIDKFTSAPTSVFQNGWGGCNPTGEFAEALIANDGIDSWRRQAWIKTYDEVLYEMPYTSDANNPTLEQKRSDPNRGVDPNQVGLYGHEGYFMWKRTPLNSDKFTTPANRFGNNLVIMRYAEVLLLYAEACAQSGTDLAGGLEALNQVQRRAGSAHISSALTLDEVKQEKRFECWMEGTRYPDLVRWGDATTALANNGKAIPTFKDLIGKQGNTLHTGFVDWTDSDYNGSNYGFKVGKNEYYPFPFGEISVNPNIIQNPGWGSSN